MIMAVIQLSKREGMQKIMDDLDHIRVTKYWCFVCLFVFVYFVGSIPVFFLDRSILDNRSRQSARLWTYRQSIERSQILNHLVV